MYRNRRVSGKEKKTNNRLNNQRMVISVPSATFGDGNGKITVLMFGKWNRLLGGTKANRNRTSDPTCAVPVDYQVAPCCHFPSLQRKLEWQIWHIASMCIIPRPLQSVSVAVCCILFFIYRSTLPHQSSFKATHFENVNGNALKLTFFHSEMPADNRGLIK